MADYYECANRSPGDEWLSRRFRGASGRSLTGSGNPGDGPILAPACGRELGSKLDKERNRNKFDKVSIKMLRMIIISQ